MSFGEKLRDSLVDSWLMLSCAASPGEEGNEQLALEFRWPSLAVGSVPDRSGDPQALWCQVIERNLDWIPRSAPSDDSRHRCRRLALEAAPLAAYAVPLNATGSYGADAVRLPPLSGDGQYSV